MTSSTAIVPMAVILQNTGKGRVHMEWVNDKKVGLSLFPSSTWFNYEGKWRVWRVMETQDLGFQGRKDVELWKYPWEEAYTEGVMKDRSGKSNRYRWRFLMRLRVGVQNPGK